VKEVQNTKFINYYISSISSTVGLLESKQSSMHSVLECRRHERTGAAGAVVISGGGISHCHCHGAGAVFSYTAQIMG